MLLMKWKNKEKVVIEAVSENGRALEFVSEELKKDEKIKMNVGRSYWFPSEVLVGLF